MGIAQKIVNAGIAVSSLVLAHAVATREAPTFESIFGNNTEAAAQVAIKPENAIRMFCVADSFKEACAPDMNEALIKFINNPRTLNAEERQARKADDEESRRSYEGGGSLKGNFAPKSDGVTRRHQNDVFVEERIQDVTGLHRGQKYKVPAHYAKILRNATAGGPLSFDIMVQLIGSESGFKAHATSDTNAVGMGQFTGATLREALWINKGKLSNNVQKVINANIERVNTADKDELPHYKYKIVKGGSMKTVQGLAKDAEVGIILACEYGKDAMEDGERRYRSALESRIKFLQTHPEKNDDPQRMARLQQHLHRDLTSTDIKIIYMAGPSGGSKILAAYADSKNLGQRASDYTAGIVTRGNPDVFFKDDDHKVHRSVAEVYRYFVSRVGNIPVREASAVATAKPTLSIG